MSRPEKPWLRQSWETPLEHGWFARYVALPKPRVITELCKLPGCPSPVPFRDVRPPGEPRTLLEMSIDFGWALRAEAYDAYRVEVELEAASNRLDAPLDFRAVRTEQAKVRALLSLRELRKHDQKSEACEHPLGALRDAERSVDASYEQLGNQLGEPSTIVRTDGLDMTHWTDEEVEAWRDHMAEIERRKR